MDHLECVVKLRDGSLDWYDPIYEVGVTDNGDLLINHAAREYIIPSEDYVDYKVRPYHPETTYNWED